jgi:hypothetical protein
MPHIILLPRLRIAAILIEWQNERAMVASASALASAGARGAALIPE